ncbi:MAG TPA: hypothetical protein VLG72_05485 [Nitrospirota bacterium]|nr:hypothetical protein [Nitrospirota bacterium]
MSKASRKAVQDLYIPAELQAAEDLGIVLTSSYVLGLRTKLKEKSHQVRGSVQYYALLDDAVWTDDELDDRIFAAVRLMYDYNSGSGAQLNDKDKRIEALSDLILRLAEQKKADLPIVRRIKAGMFGRRIAPALED